MTIPLESSRLQPRLHLALSTLLTLSPTFVAFLSVLKASPITHSSSRPAPFLSEALHKPRIRAVVGMPVLAANVLEFRNCPLLLKIII